MVLIDKTNEILKLSVTCIGELNDNYINQNLNRPNQKFYYKSL
ncbi:MAG: hypothetical protein JWN56_991 [Sphingobacteriales bacterium]|nr:hypothetical protein [Sphingobacteriales bacterium]